MLAKVGSAALWGIDMVGVAVEVNVSSRGFPGFEIVGLAHKSVSESKERVKTAVMNSGYAFPTDKKVIVNLAPADLPKDGSFYDLPIAVAIIALVSNSCVPTDSLFFGELSLDGSLRRVRGALLLSMFAKENGYRKVFVPAESYEESSCVRGVKVLAFSNLREIVGYLKEGKIPKRHKMYESGEVSSREINNPDFYDILGQETAKRALEIAAAGAHNIVMVGPPGAGKTLLGRAFTSILPPLSLVESLEVTKIYSVKGLLSQHEGLIKDRPFRNPHHTISYAAFLGGGIPPRPGEVSLAHRGVLFLDEFSEFPRALIECLRQPLEDGFFQIGRSGGSYKFPCNFTLVAASNPCMCGYYGHPFKTCKCTPPQRERYRQRISGPIYDRIDIHIKVIPVSVDNLTIKTPQILTRNVDNSATIRNRIIKARDRQKNRFLGLSQLVNSEMTNEQVSRSCFLTGDADLLLKRAVVRFGLSARSYFKILKVSRTIADLADCEHLESDHIAEAIQYRTAFT